MSPPLTSSDFGKAALAFAVALGSAHVSDPAATIACQFDAGLQNEDSRSIPLENLVDNLISAEASRRERIHALRGKYRDLAPSTEEYFVWKTRERF